jgi:PKD repeat protein
LDNQPSLIFGFRFVNNATTEFADPAFGVDEIVVSGTASTVNTISTGSVNAGPYCPGDIISIPFTSSGIFNSGNVYTAQLSNASGSFAGPTSIGTLNSTANSGIITATIPAGALAGVAYQIQVVSSNPAITGSPNGTNIIINGPPTASISAITSINICTGETVGFAFSGSAGNIQWQQSTDAINYTNIVGAINSTYTSLPLISNTYFRAVITNNCGTSNSTSILVTISSGITATIIQSPSGNNLCNGPITLSIPSGYVNITWSNGQMATSTIVVTTPGDYSVTANTVSGCPVTSNTVSIIETTPTPLLVNPTGPITLCSGTATLTAQSGFNNYSWNSGQFTPTISVSSGGNFIVTAIDANGCLSTSNPVEISIGSSVPIIITPANAAICSGDPAVLTASTGFISYLWSNGATTPSISVADAGFYSVTGIDANGCNGASTSVSVVKSEYPIANFIYTQTAGFTLQFDNSSQNAINQQWIFGSIGSSPDVNPQYSFPGNGVYPVTLIISNPCGEDTIVKTIVVVPLGFQGSDALGFHVSISPNPFNSFINLQSILSYPSDIKISLTDMMGKVVLNKSWNSLTENNVLEVPDVPNGLYILSLQSARGFVSFKLVRS